MADYLYLFGVNEEILPGLVSRNWFPCKEILPGEYFFKDDSFSGKGQTFSVLYVALSLPALFMGL